MLFFKLEVLSILFENDMFMFFGILIVIIFCDEWLLFFCFIEVLKESGVKIVFDFNYCVWFWEIFDEVSKNFK